MSQSFLTCRRNTEGQNVSLPKDPNQSMETIQKSSLPQNPPQKNYKEPQHENLPTKGGPNMDPAIVSKPRTPNTIPNAAWGCCSTGTSPSEFRESPGKVQYWGFLQMRDTFLGGLWFRGSDKKDYSFRSLI